MQKDGLFFTAGQFAQLHHLNKRTLHYYDNIGLFSPAHIGDNGYRYYTYPQSAELENILALRELGMSIEEIKGYLKHPNPQDFLEIAHQKTQEIDEQIKRLKKLKNLLQEKQEALNLCAHITDGQILIRKRPKQTLLLTPLNYQETPLAEMDLIMAHLQIAWALSTYKTNCGSYIALDKIRQAQFDIYDGLFTLVDNPQKGVAFSSRPAGDYLCGYCIGDWSKIPLLYNDMLAFAEQNGLPLSGCCYEMGLNEFAIAKTSEYITQIEIQIAPSAI